jgi:signal transduction histidine kinase
MGYIWIHVLLVAALIYFGLIVFVLARASGRGDAFLLFLLVTSFFWPTLYYGVLISDSLPVMIWITGVRFALIPLMPLSLMLLVLHITGKMPLVPRWGWGVLWGVPALLAAFCLTITSHRYLLYDFEVVHLYGVSVLTFKLGPVYYLYQGYIYTVSGIHLALQVYWYIQGSYSARRQCVLLLVASAIPLVFDVGRMLGLEPMPGFSIAPALLPISGVLIIWAITGYRLAQVSPVARTALLDLLPSIVVVLDEMQRIVDINQRGCRDIGLSKEEMIRTLPERLHLPWNLWLSPDWSPPEAVGTDGELEVVIGERSCFFARSVLPLSQGSRHMGHLIYLDDVTASREANRERAERERLQAQQWLLTDLHDGVGGIAAHIGLLAQMAQMADDPESQAQSLKGIMGLAQEMGAEVRRFMSVLEQADFGWNDWMLEIRRFCQTTLDGLPIRLELDIASSPSVRPMRADAGLSIYRLIKEGVTNAVKHADASAIRVTAKLGDEELFIEVRDNGRGFTGPVQEKRGLPNIRDRVRRLGGRAEIRTDQGVTHRIWVPVANMWRTPMRGPT